MDNNKIHDLAVAFASIKLQEYEVSKREAPLCGNTDISEDEIKYFKLAYDYATEKLSE